ncbi:MAG: hypothetical protein C0501_26745 [Isosphaera sp.]|nr:hypothetical protein [Isosphaera sp.]
MDGRRLRRWWLSGCLAALGAGCNRQEVQSPWGTPPGVAPPATTAKKPAPVVPVEVVDASRKGPPKPETRVAFADVQLDAAFDESTPPTTRQELLDAARRGYQKALETDPKNKAALLGLARYYSRVGERDRAVEVYKKYLTGNPADRDVPHEVAVAHARWKDWAGAVAWCEYALKLDPENLSVRKTMAFCLARDGRWDEGYGVMAKVMPEAQARYLMARVLEHQNHPAASRHQLVLALQADPTYVAAREFLAELDQLPALGGTPPAQDPNALRQAGYAPGP